MASNPVTRIIITAKDEASAVFTGLRAHAGKIATAIAGYFGVKMFGDAVGSAREFESAMSAVQAASGATGEELAALKAAAEQAGASTKYTSVEAANALENLAKAGLSASDAVKTLPAVLNLAQAGGVDLATASEYVTKAVAGMGLSFAEAGRVADVLAMGANASQTSVEGLAGALSFAAPVAQAMGLSLEQTVAIIGKFADAGIDASRAGTALNSMLSQFADPASKFRTELAAAGITTSNFDTTLRQLAAAGPAGEKAILAVGQEAGPALRALLNQGIGALDTLKQKLDESAGSAATFAKVMGDNLDGAAKGIGSAWDALLIKVGTPVLETLKDQVNAVSEQLRAFVSNGTATAFGEAIKAAFETAGKWAADFLSNVDFNKLAADMQAFAARAGEVFSAIGGYATTAGRTADLAYGVMSAGINTVMTAVYSLGKGMSWLTSAFLADLSLISEAASKVTFGDMSRGFAEAAAKLKFEAQAAYAVSEEFGRKSAEAFNAATEGAARAQEGWKGLTETATESAGSTSAALAEVEQQSTLTADQLDALGNGAQVAGGKVVEAGAAAAGASAEVAKLGTAAKSAAADLAESAASVEQVNSAFDRLGVTSVSALKQAAANALRDFKTIRDSGIATPRDISAAFTAYAQKAIAANNGVATSALKSEASLYKVKIEADSAGKTIVSSMSAGASAIASVGAQADATADKIGAIKRQASGLDGVWDENGNLVDSGGGVTSAKFMDMGQGYIFDRAERLGGLEYRQQLEEQARKEAKKIGSVGIAGLDSRYPAIFQRITKQLDELQIQQEKASGKFVSNDPRATQNTAAAPGVAAGTYRVEIGIGSGRSTAINTASQSDADALINLLRQLEEAASRT